MLLPAVRPPLSTAEVASYRCAVTAELFGNVISSRGEPFTAILVSFFVVETRKRDILINRFQTMRLVLVSGTVSMLVANPKQLNTEGQQTALLFSVSLVQGSQEVGLTAGMGAAHAVGNTISSVIEAGLLNNTGTGSVADQDRVAMASMTVRDTLQNLSAVMLAPALAGEAAVEVHTPTLSVSASRMKADSLQSGTPTAIVMTGKPSAAGVIQPSFVLPANFTLEDAPNDIDTTLIAWRASPYAFDSSGSQGAAVLSASLKSGTKILVVANLSIPIELALVTADPTYWRKIYALKKCSNDCVSANDGVCDDGAASSVGSRRRLREHLGMHGDDLHGNLRRLEDCSKSAAGPVCAWGTDCDDCGERASSIDVSLEPTCTYWDEESSRWSSEGCTFIEFRDDFNTTVCGCTHLTDFSSTFGKITTVLSVLKDVDMCLLLQVSRH
jgi:hypothetical protein